MSARLEAALAELVAAISDEVTTVVRASAAPPELLGIPEAAHRLGIGRTALYDAIGRGEVRSLRIGRRRLIPADALSNLAERDGLVVAPSKQKGASSTKADTLEDGDASAHPRRTAE